MIAKQRLASVEDLRERGPLKFTYRAEGIPREGILAWHDGQVICYENVCRHVPITLDYGDGQFFTPDKRHLRCQTHGALYEPLTGRCVSGPCQGEFLKKLPFEIENQSVLLLITE